METTEPATLKILSAERLATFELCPRRAIWQERYKALRVSPLKALYMALDAGLRTADDPEKAAQDELIGLARSPGLDLLGEGVFAIAQHYAKLAGILAVALRSAWEAPWTPVEAVPLPRRQMWRSSLYNSEEGVIRRIALIDRWSDDRKMQETYGWRTMGEVCALNKTILMTAITIGTVHDRRRHSPWTLAHQNPINRTIRFKRRERIVEKNKGKKILEGFAGNWLPIWREDSLVKTEDWLSRMREDGCMADLVHTISVPVPRKHAAYMEQMLRLGRQMGRPMADPPMRLAGCFGFSPCTFRGVCHSAGQWSKPEQYGFQLREK